MANKDKIETDIEGRLSDGWAYAVDMAGGATVRLADHDDLRSVWARIRAAQKADEDVFFSGARPAEIDAEGKQVIGMVDGAGVRAAKDILSIRNYGGSAAGYSEIRLARIEEGLSGVAAAVNGVIEDVEAIDEELRGRVPGWQGIMEEEEGDEPPAGAPPLSIVGDVPPGVEEARAAMQAQGDDGEEG